MGLERDCPRGRLIVVSFDPGETTGFARLALSKRLLVEEGATAALRAAGRDGRVNWDHFGSKGSHGFLDEEGSAARMLMLTRLGWVEAVRDAEVDTFVVVIEDFVLFRSEKSRSLLAPVRLTARFEQELVGSGLRVVKQSPADAKRVVTDARLRSWGAFEEGGVNRHARDALRHAILFARKWSSSKAVRAAVGVGRVP